MQAYPVTYHRIGDTWDRTQRYALPSGTWTPASIARTSSGTLVQTFSASLTALSAPDADGNTHVLNTVATATQTAAWPLATLICDTTFTDASATPVVRSAEAFNIAATAHLPPVLDEYATLAVIPGDLVALLRGEQGPAGATGATGDTGAAGAGVPTGGTTGQVLAKKSGTDRDTEWVDPTGGSGGGATNLGYTASATNGVVTSDTGTDATIPAADVTNAGLLTPAQFSKLAATSGTNTGDQDLSGYSLTSHNHTGTYDPAGTASSAVADHAGTGGTAHANAVASGAAGFMTGADKAKLDGVAAGAQVNPASTDALTEGSTNLYHTAARVRAALLTGLSTATATVVNATHTVLEAIGFLQKQVSDNATAISGKQDTLVSGTNIKTVNSTSLLGSGDITVGASIAPLVVEDANTLAQRNGTTAQTSYLYNTISGANYERGFLRWASNVFEIGAEKGGTGTARSVRLANLSGTAASVTFSAVDLNNPVITGALNLKLSCSAAMYLAGTSVALGDVNFSSGYYNGLSVQSSGALLQFGRDIASPKINVGPMLSNGDAKPLTLEAGSCAASATSGSGGAMYVSGGAGAAAATSSAANGGPLNLFGGPGYGTGTAGQVNLAYTGSAARGNVKCWGVMNLAAGLATAISAKTADYTLTTADHTATFDATAAARTATLPALSTVTAGQEYIAIKIDSSANALTLDGNAAETINGAANISTTTQWAALRVKANADKSAWVTF